MALLSDAEIPALRAAFETMLTHTCTLTPIAGGPPDAHYNETPEPGTPVTGVRCTYSTVATVARAEGGTKLVNLPTLSVSATQPISIGDEVTAITDQLGVVLLAGPARVERLIDDTAGLGAAMLSFYELRAADVLRAG